MLVLTAEQKAGLGVALNEATLLGIEVDPRSETAVVSLAPLTLLPEGPAPPDYRVSFVLREVGRVTASLRMGRWDDPLAEVVPLEIQDLARTVSSFGALPIYGWEFIDVHQAELERLGNRISLDWRSVKGESGHSLMVFQEGSKRHLDVIIWFDSFVIRDNTGQPVDLATFIAGGERWWKALQNGDPRTQGPGIFPLK